MGGLFEGRRVYPHREALLPIAGCGLHIYGAATERFGAVPIVARRFHEVNSATSMRSVLTLIYLVNWARPFPTADSVRCKATPYGTGWPLKESWDLLNDTVAGRLLQPQPPGAVCHQTQLTFAPAECAKVQALWEDEFFHSENPISVEWNNWVNDTCPPDPKLACSSSGYPIYVINATAPEHVKAGIDFGRALSRLSLCSHTGS